MSLSIFYNKSRLPDEMDLKEALEENYKLWNDIIQYVYRKYPEAREKWSFTGKRYGWSFNLRDKKRAIISLIPSEGFFKAALIYGKKAIRQVLDSDISLKIKKIINSAGDHSEGRGFRIDVTDKETAEDIKKLVDIKLEN